MSLPVVAIVGRPNVGKSSLFNCLVQRRVAIVDAMAGVTRDRIQSPWCLGDDDDARWAELVDTGGMGIEDSDNLTDHVEDQIAYAVNTANIIIFVADARDGITPLDRHVATVLRKQEKPVLLIANKVDTATSRVETADLNKLGFGEPLEVSAKHNSGMAEIRDTVAAWLGDEAGDAPDDSMMKLAIVGKRNAGKSTFINALAGENRVIVSEVPGTTRDSVDVIIERTVPGSVGEDGEQRARKFMLIDTAGVRKKSSLASDVEYYSQHRAFRSVRRADVVALIIDASLPISQVDKDLAGQIEREDKPVVLVVNKWDLARETADSEDYAEYLEKVLPFLPFAPVCMTCAETGENLWETIETAEDLYAQSRTRVSTGELNRVIAEILALRGPSHKMGTRPPKIRYASQIAVQPPTIICMVNDPRSFDRSYRRFMVNQFRKRLPYSEVPIRLFMRRSSDDRHAPEEGD